MVNTYTIPYFRGFVKLYLKNNRFFITLFYIRPVFTLNFLLCEVYGTPFYLHIGLGKVLSEDSGTKKTVPRSEKA